MNKLHLDQIFLYVLAGFGFEVLSDLLQSTYLDGIYKTPYLAIVVTLTVFFFTLFSFAFAKIVEIESHYKSILVKTREELKYAFKELLWIDAISILLLMARFSLLCSIHVWKILIMTGLNACLLMTLHTIVDLGKTILMIFDWTKNKITTSNTNNTNDMNTPKVSIVVPVYKVPENFLRQCIESCINQTLKDIEIILVDDGSPDNCGKICDEYAEKDDRIKVIHKKNGGLAAARNSGQNAATGFSMMFLDGDDYLDASCCEATYNAMIQNNVELVMFDEYNEFQNSSRVEYSFDDGKGSRIFSQDECKQLQLRVLDFNGKIAMAFCKLMRTDYLKKNRIRHVDELKQGAEGFVFNIQLYEHLDSAYYLHMSLLHYNYNPTSISHTANNKNNLMIVRCMEWIDNYVEHSRNDRKKLHKGVMNRMLYIICTTAITGIFNPYNQQTHKDKVKDFEEFLSLPLVNAAISLPLHSDKVNMQRKIILLLIKLKLYRCLELLGWMRRKQLENR